MIRRPPSPTLLPYTTLCRSRATRAQALEERAAEFLLDLLARLLDGDLGERGDRGGQQELVGLPRRVAAGDDDAEHLVAGGDGHVGAEIGRASCRERV